MLYRKFALVVGVFALALVPSAARAEYMQITFQTLNSSGAVASGVTFDDNLSDGNTWTTNPNPPTGEQQYSTTENGITVVKTVSTTGLVNFSLQPTVFSTLSVGGVTITGSLSTTNSPGGPYKANLDLSSIGVTNTNKGSTILLITATSLGFTSPNGNVEFSQTGSYSVNQGTIVANATSYLSTTNENFALDASSSTVNPGSLDTNNSTTYASTPTSLTNGGYFDPTPTQLDIGTTTVYSLTTQATYTLSGTNGTFGSGASGSLDPDPTVAAPEPSSFVLAFLGLSCVGGQRWLSRRKKRAADA